MVIGPSPVAHQFFDSRSAFLSEAGCMKPVIETLEGRRLLAGQGAGPGAGLLAKAEGVDDPAVQATLVLIEEDQSNIAAAREQARSGSTESRAALRETIATGLDLLAADRLGIFDAHGGPD